MNKRVFRPIQRKTVLLLITAWSLLVCSGCTEENANTWVEPPVIDRESKIPAGAVKVTPKTDMYPPVLHSDEYEQPVPLSYPINTAGAEDSPFILPDGEAFYFFFTPDVLVPVEKQIIDGVTGIYVSHEENGVWGKPQRVVLNNDISLDGCAFVQGNTMWFCSARKGYTGVHWFKAELVDGRWQNWKCADDEFPETYEVGELHITSDGTELYFHSPRTGGKGNYDIWVAKRSEGTWLEPENIQVVNTADSEGWPFVTQDGNELWFTRFYMGSPGIFRSKRVQGNWSEPELIISSFAGEPTLDNEGNIYFVHHFYSEGQMIEADIYVARKKLG